MPRSPLTDAQRELVEANVGVVGPIAARVRGTRRDVHLDDLVSDGYLGLIAAAQRFDAGRGVDFRAFAKHRVLGAIMDGFRARDLLRRADRADANAIARARGSFTRAEGRYPDDDELATALGWSAERLRRSRANLSVSVVSLDVPLASGPMPSDVIPDHDLTPEELLEREYPEVYPALDVLNEQQRLVVGMTFWQDMTASEIARVMMVSANRVHQIKHDAMGRLRSELTR